MTYQFGEHTQKITKELFGDNMPSDETMKVLEKTDELSNDYEKEILKLKIELKQVKEKAKLKSEYLNNAFEELLKNNEDIIKAKEKENEQKVELEKAYAELKSAQSHMIQSEKMASLGALISGITHEINTPLAVIHGGLSNLNELLDYQFKDFTDFARKADEKVFEKLNEAIEYIRDNKASELTTREERKLRRSLTAELEDQNITGFDNVVSDFIRLGLHEKFEEFMPYLKREEGEKMLSSISKIGSINLTTSNMVKAVKKMQKIIFALKNYSYHRETEKPEEINVILGLETVITLYFNEIKQGINLIRNYDEDDIVLINGYVDQLDQVWTNLINNSIQAMKGHGEMEISVNKMGTNVVISIRDTGPGIPKDIIEKVFTPFFTTKPQGEGTGLGLDISKKIIEKHQGYISVESEPGNTVFTVTLPLKQS